MILKMQFLDFLKNFFSTDSNNLHKTYFRLNKKYGFNELNKVLRLNESKTSRMKH